MNRRQMIRGLLALAGAGFLSGCGGPASATISGEVTVGGVPLEKGVISFAPLDGAGGPATAEINNGKYEVRTLAGNKQVQISAPVVKGKRKEYDAPDAPLVEVTEESIPEKYNAKSELKFEAKPGNNTKDWQLDARKK